MNKTLLYVILAIVLALLVGGYIYMRPDSEEGSNAEGDGEGSEMEEARSIKDLVADGEPVRCTFSRSDDNSETNGVTYVANGKVKGEFEVMMKTGPTANQRITSNMIIDGDTMYMWSSSMPQGMKMKVDAQATADAEAGQQSAINYDEQLDYDCDSWDSNSSVFELPSGVTFLDLNLGGQTQPSGPGGVNPPNACASCDVITDAAAKAQCKVALNCN
jgi:hypothetical protein